VSTASLSEFKTDAEIREIVERYRRHLGDARVLLDDKDVTDFYRNPQDDRIWVKTHSKGKTRSPYAQDPTNAAQFAAAIVQAYGAELNEANSRISCAIPYYPGRFTAFCPPTSRSGVGWIVRILHDNVMKLEDYLENGSIANPKTVQDIRTLIAERANILIVGPQGAGKTTLLNTILDESAKVSKGRDRWVLIEDADELRCSDPDHIKLHVQSSADWTDLIAFALRTSSDRIVLGELRHGATPLLDALSTGSPGYATGHGSSPAQGLRRIETLLRNEGTIPDREEIAESIHAVIVMRRVGHARIIRDVVRVAGLAPGGYAFKKVS
jgi:type IV secretion system protein VirB11